MGTSTADSTEDLLKAAEEEIVADERRQSLAEERRKSVADERRNSSVAAVDGERRNSHAQARKSITPGSENQKTADEDIPEEGDPLIERVHSPEIDKDAGVENPNKDAEEDAASDRTGDADGFPAKDIKEDINVEVVGTGQFVNEALDQKRTRAKDAFQKLIEENAKLEHDFNVAHGQLNEVLEQRDAFASDLEFVKSENKQLTERVATLEKQVADANELAKAAAEAAADNEPTGGARDSCADETREGAVPAEQKLKELNLRLQRLAKDDLEKDTRLRELEAEVAALTSIIGRLEPLVADKAQFEEIMASKNAGMEDDDGNYDHSNYVVDAHGTQTQSKVCIIQ